MTKLLAQDLNWANVSTTYRPLTQITAGNYVAGFIQIGLIIIVVACLLFLLIGGVRWITSKGEKEALAKSQKTISGAIIGLIIALAIFVILGLLSAFTRVNLLQFCIPGINGNCSNIRYSDQGPSGGPNIPGNPNPNPPPPGLPIGPCGCGNNSVGLCAPLATRSNWSGRCYSCQFGGWQYEPAMVYPGGCNDPVNCYTCP